jgi:hypothetical protein
MSAIAPPFTGVARVDLMPRSEVARRERDKHVRLWIWIVFGAVLLAMLIIGGTIWFKLLADQRLAAEQAQTDVLLTEIASLSEVSQALSTESELTAFRTEAMATDLAWTPVLDKITGILPAGTALTGYDFAVAGVPQGDNPTLEPGVVGTVSIDSPTPLDIVAIIRSLRAVEGVLYADGQSVTPSQVSEGSFAYLLNVQFDQTVYTGAYAPVEEGEE